MSVLESSNDVEEPTAPSSSRIERGERTESANRLSQVLGESVQSLEHGLIESDERMSNLLWDFRQSTLDRMKGIVDDMTKQIDTLESSQNRSLEELRGRSIERNALAGFFTELALRVRGEFAVLGNSDGDPKP